MFKYLETINKRPRPFEVCTTPLYWNDKHLSKKMLDLHLDEHIDLASRKITYIDMSSDWISSRFNLGPDKAICDFGCGPGLYTLRFAEKGADVTGIDFSRRSIEYAKNAADTKCIEVEYVLKNYLDFSTDKRFDLVTMIYCDYCVLSSPQRQVLLRKIHDILKEGGCLLLDVFSINHFKSIHEKMTCEYSERNGFWSPNPYYVFANTFKYEKEKVFLDKYTIVEKTRTREIFNWIQCFSLQVLEKELREHRFQVIETYSDASGTAYRQDSNEIAVIAKRL